MSWDYKTVIKIDDNSFSVSSELEPAGDFSTPRRDYEEEDNMKRSLFSVTIPKDLYDEFEGVLNIYDTSNTDGLSYFRGYDTSDATEFEEKRFGKIVINFIRYRIILFNIGDSIDLPQLILEVDDPISYMVKR